MYVEAYETSSTLLLLTSRELNFAEVERAHFAGLNFRDLAKRYVKNVKIR